MAEPTECKDCRTKLGEHGMCKCGAFYCRECGKWGHCSDLGSVVHHEHKGMREPWGIKGTRVPDGGC